MYRNVDGRALEANPQRTIGIASDLKKPQTNDSVLMVVRTSPITTIAIIGTTIKVLMRRVPMRKVLQLENTKTPRYIRPHVNFPNLSILSRPMFSMPYACGCKNY